MLREGMVGWPLLAQVGSRHYQLLLEKEEEPPFSQGVPLWGSNVSSVPGGRRARIWRSGDLDSATDHQCAV